jgi:N-acetylmuramoyl-L-alanine amidase
MKNALKIFLLLIVFISTSFDYSDQKIVVIDAGHGGQDKGATAEEIAEKEIVLRVAQKIQELAKKSGVVIKLTRDTDDFLTIADRVAYINSTKPDIVISLHANTSDNENKNGTELYISEKEESRFFAEIMKKNMPSERGEAIIKTGNFYLLKNVDCPATLIELGYLTNLIDKAYLMSEKGQNEMAQAIFKSL